MTKCPSRIKSGVKNGSFGEEEVEGFWHCCPPTIQEGGIGGEIQQIGAPLMQNYSDPGGYYDTEEGER